MLHLPDSLRAWGTPGFAAALQRELAQQSDALPLQQGLTMTSHVSDGRIEVMLLGAEEAPDAIHVRVGIFFAGVVAGCNCADDPTPVTPQPEYCELQLDIDMTTAKTTAVLKG